MANITVKQITRTVKVNVVTRNIVVKRPINNVNVVKVGRRGEKGDPGDPASNLVTSVNGKQGVVVLDKTDIGLANVDNTSDINKPVSTAQATAIAVVQSDINAHEANTSNPHSVTKTQVGLGNVDNTSDVSKPISTATQTALDAKKTNSMTTERLLGRGTAGTGVIEEIIIGTGLELDGTTLNVTGGGGAVNSVNGQTGVVVLDTDDIDDTATNRYTNDTDIARLAGTSGTNTGDQTLASYGITSSVAELNFTDGVTSSIQTQLDSKLSTATASATYQPLDSDLTTIAGLTPTTNNFMVASGSAWASRTPTQAIAHLGLDADIATFALPASTTISTFGATLVDDADATTARSTLGLIIGTNVQAYDADLATIAGLTATTDNFIVSVSSAWASRTPAQVRTTLGLVIGTNVQAYDADLAALATAGNSAVLVATTASFLTAHATKLGFITVTQAVNLDTMESDIALKANDADVVHDTGNETIAGVKTFSSDPIIPDEAYGIGWDGSLEPATKNALYDKIQTIVGGSADWGDIGGTLSDQTDLQTALDSKATIDGDTLGVGFKLGTLDNNTFTLVRENEDRLIFNTGEVEIRGGTAGTGGTTLIVTDVDGANAGLQVYDDKIVKISDSYTLPNADGATGQFIQTNGSGTASWQYAGDVVGPAGATDNAIAVYDTTSGKLLKDSPVIVNTTTGIVTTPGGYIANNTPGTYTSALSTALSQTGTFTLNYATPGAPSAVYDGSVIQVQQSQSPFFGGALFSAGNTVKNLSGVTANLGPYYVVYAATNFNADAANISQSASFPIFINNNFTTTGGGTLATTQFSGMKVGGSVGSGVTVTEWRGVEINSPANTGVITTVYGIKIDPITTGTTTNVGLAIGASTTNTLWLANTTNPTTLAGGVVMGSSKDIGFYRSAAGKLTVTGDVIVDDEVYGAGWNGSLETPTKNAVYDEMETKLDTTAISDTAYGSGWNGDTTNAPSKNSVYDKIESMVAGSGVSRGQIMALASGIF